MKYYSMDHHDRMIYDILPWIVSMEPIIHSEYFDARVKPLKSLSIPKLSIGVLKDDAEFNILPIWPDINEVQKKIFNIFSKADDE